MNIYNHIQSKVYANDPDYDAFHGRVVAEYTVERVDRRRNCTIRTTYEVIDIGRPDRVVPVDPDAQMGTERLSVRDNTASTSKAQEAWRAAARLRDEAMLGEVRSYLQQYGPSHVAAIRNDLGYAQTTLGVFLKRHNGSVFCQVGKVGNAPIWGLVGIHDKGDDK